MSIWTDAPMDTRHGSSRRVPLRRPDPIRARTEPQQHTLDALREQVAALRGDDHFTKRERARLLRLIEQREEVHGGEAKNTMDAGPSRSQIDGQEAPLLHEAVRQQCRERPRIVRERSEDGQGAVGSSALASLRGHVDAPPTAAVADAPPASPILVRQPPPKVEPVRSRMASRRSGAGDRPGRQGRQGTAAPPRPVDKGRGASQAKRAVHVDAPKPRSGKGASTDAIGWLISHVGEVRASELVTALRGKSQTRMDAAREIHDLGYGGGIAAAILAGVKPALVAKWKFLDWQATRGIGPGAWLRRRYTTKEADKIEAALKDPARRKAMALRVIAEVGEHGALGMVARLAGVSHAAVSKWKADE